MTNWQKAFDDINSGLSEDNLEIVFVQPLLEELGFRIPNNLEKNKYFTGKIRKEPKSLKPDYTCWKTDDKSAPPLLVVEDKKSTKSDSDNTLLIGSAIEQVQEQMLVTQATFGLATNGLQYQLWQRHGQICVPRTRVMPLGADTVDQTITDLNSILQKPKTALTVMFWNNKGGVGKTTITANIAATLAMEGKKVLVVNLDFQGDLNIAFGLPPKHKYEPKVTFGDVLNKVGLLGHDESMSIEDIKPLIRTKKYEIKRSGFLGKAFGSSKTIKLSLDIIPGDNSFDEQAKNFQSSDVLLRLLEQHFAYTYEYIFLDIAPSLQDVGIVGAIAADVLFPIVDTPSYAVTAIPRVLAVFNNSQEFEELKTPEPILHSIVFNPKYQNQGTVESSRKKIQQKLSEENIDCEIHSLKNYAEIDNAVEEGKPVVVHKPGSNCAKAFNELACKVFGITEV